MSIISLKESASGTSGSKTALPLDMAEDSVDDMYSYCKDKMMSKVQSEILENEKNKNEKFKSAWNKAEEVYNQSWKPKTATLSPYALTKEEFIAVYVYTSAPGDPHIEFNNAVRNSRSAYKTTFGYHALHFFLTTAVQKLNSEAGKCTTGYRGVNVAFKDNVLNKEIRFGSFASTTMFGLAKAKQYGDKSCFKILTCFGGDVSIYSKFGDAEAEVLIPPYEVFKVKSIKKRSEQPGLECEVVYEVDSTEIEHSGLNCAFFPK